MKKTLLALLVLLPLQSFATYTLSFGQIKDVWSYNNWLEDLGEYRITRVKAETISSAEGSKLFGRWKKCYKSRYENNPRMPFGPKYIYTSKKVYKDLEVSIVNDKQIELGNILESHKDVAKSLDEKTKGKCRLSTSTKIVVEYFLVESGKHIHFQHFVSEKDGKLQLVNYTFNQQGQLDETVFILKEDQVIGPIHMATYPYNGSF